MAARRGVGMVTPKPPPRLVRVEREAGHWVFILRLWPWPRWLIVTWGMVHRGADS